MLSLSAREEPKRTLNLTTWYDFIVQQEYPFLKNLYSPEDIKKMDSLKTLEDFYDMFEYFLDVVVFPKDDSYIRSHDSEKIEKIKEFFATYCPDCNDSSKIIELIDNFKIVQKYNGGYKNKNNKLYKLIEFVYDRVMGFIATDEVKGAIIFKNFLSNVDYLINGKTVIHHSHITTDVIGYAHSFCNLKFRENKNQISVVAHNMFGFDLFFFFKGLRLGA